MSEKTILAVVTGEASRAHGGVPVLVISDQKERDRVAFLLGRLLDAMVHDLGNQTYVVVRH